MWKQIHGRQREQLRSKASKLTVVHALFTQTHRVFTHFSRFFTHVSTTCVYHDVWSTDITARIQCPTKVESAGLTGTLPKFKLNLHVEHQGKLVNVRQRLPTNGVNGDKLFNGIYRSTSRPTLDWKKSKIWHGKHCWHWCEIADKDHYTWPCHILHMSGGFTETWKRLRSARKQSPTALGEPKILMAIPRLCGIQKHLAKSMKRWLNSHAPHWKSLGWCRDPYSVASTPRVLAFCQVIGLIGSRSRQKQTWCGHSRGQPWIGGKHCWHWCGIADKHHYTWPCHRLHMSGGLGGGPIESHMALGQLKILMAIPRLCGIQKILPKQWTFGWIRIMQHAGFRWNNWADVTWQPTSQRCQRWQTLQ